MLRERCTRTKVVAQPLGVTAGHGVCGHLPILFTLRPPGPQAGEPEGPADQTRRDRQMAELWTHDRRQSAHRRVNRLHRRVPPSNWFTQVIIAVCASLVLPAGCGTETTEDAPAPQRESSSEPKKKAQPKSPRAKLRAALPKGTEVTIDAAEITVTAPTPEGGFSGPSAADLNDEASEIFHAIYGKAGYKRASVVLFQGGLTDTRTGKELPDANTGIFTMPKEAAADIDWSDEDVWRYTIDWSNYRDFAHPALKQD